MTADREHPDWNELAALADLGPDEARPELLAHLAGCAACLAAWSAVVEHRDRELAAVTATAPRAKVVVLRRAWGTAGLAVAALLLFLILPREIAGPSAEGPEHRLQQRLSSLSHTGLVFPRVLDLTGAPPADYRAGATNGAGLDLSVWADRFAADTGDTEAAFWLAAGHLARGQLGLADDVLRRALRRSPQAIELRHLAAIAAYQRSDLPGAVSELQAILRDHPGHALARFNLAVIAVETGEASEVRPVLEGLAADPAHPALQTRARQLLEAIDRR